MTQYYNSCNKYIFTWIFYFQNAPLRKTRVTEKKRGQFDRISKIFIKSEVPTKNKNQCLLSRFSNRKNFSFNHKITWKVTRIPTETIRLKQFGTILFKRNTPIGAFSKSKFTSSPFVSINFQFSVITLPLPFFIQPLDDNVLSTGIMKNHAITAIFLKEWTKRVNETHFSIMFFFFRCN